MKQYRVDKKEVGATLYLSDGSTMEGRLFLSPYSALHSGPQTVAELLAEAGHALPFATSEGTFLLAGTACLVAVAVTGSDQAAEGFWAREPARLRLAGGHALRGSLLFEEGSGHRLSDVVRAPDPWLVLEAAGSVIWVSKAHLLTLTPENA